MHRADHNVREALAAEYVLGVLRGGARRRFEQILDGDAELREIVDRFQERVAPMAWAVAPVDPPPYLFATIERRLDSDSARSAGIYARMRRWRRAALGLAAALVLTIGSAVFLARPPPSPLVAVLAGPGREAAWVVWTRPGAAVLNVRVLRAIRRPAGRSLELWLLPKSGAPHAVGLLPARLGAVARFHLGYAVKPGVFKALAVSLEPPGGAPGTVPTGPILYKGVLAAVEGNDGA